MAVFFWQDVSILAGSVELATQAKGFQASVEAAELDTTSLATTGWTDRIAGTLSGSFSVDLMGDFTANGQNATLDGYLSTVGVPKSFIIGSADGSPAYMMNGIGLQYAPILGSQGELGMANYSGRATSPVVRGMLLHPTSTARTASGTGTARQLGAVTSTKRVYAALHVIAASGTTPSLTVKVQSDNASGFPSAADILTFSAATARSYEWKSAAGPITDDWWRVTWTISGTSPSFTFGVTVGIL